VRQASLGTGLVNARP